MEKTELSASHAILLMISLRFHVQLALCRLWVFVARRGSKSAINIECRVKYYDVLIDCLTTTAPRRNKNKREI